MMCKECGRGMLPGGARPDGKLQYSCPKCGTSRIEGLTEEEIEESEWRALPFEERMRYLRRQGDHRKRTLDNLRAFRASVDGAVRKAEEELAETAREYKQLLKEARENGST